VTLRVPIGGSDDLLADDSIASDDEGLRHAGGLVLLRDAVRRVTENRERQAALAREGANGRIRRLGVDTHGDDFEPLWAKVMIQPLNRRHFDDTRGAPSGPDVEQYHGAPVLVQPLGSPISIHTQCSKIRSFGTETHQKKFVAVPVEQRERRERQNPDSDTDHCPLLPSGHVKTSVPSLARRRSSPISARGSAAANTACPATNVSAPARKHVPIVSRLIPPSTSSTARLLVRVMSSRVRRILSIECAMNCCPPNPGFTVITRTVSTSGTMSTRASTGVAGLMTTPAAQPSSLIR